MSSASLSAAAVPVDARVGPQALLPTRFGEFRIRTYPSPDGGEANVALVRGDPSRPDSVLVRVHSECLTGDVFSSLRCDCGAQLDAALERLGRCDDAVLVYLRQEGRGIGLEAKIQAYALQDRGLDTYDANVALGYPPDARTYEAAAHILADLGARRVRLLTNNPDKVRALSALGIEVVEVLPLVAGVNPHNRNYLNAKRERFGHLLPSTLR